MTKAPITFVGDDGTTGVDVPLGNQLNILGGADSAQLSDGNIGVVANDISQALTVQLAKELKGLTSVTTEDASGNATTQSVDGITITRNGRAVWTFTPESAGGDEGYYGRSYTLSEVGNGSVTPGGM